jgi:hypothetical protein
MRRSWLALSLALAPLGCDRVGDFDTAVGQAYCGRITLAAAYRTGLSPRVQMRMTFDSGRIDAGESPGLLTPFDAGAESPTQLIVDAPLRPMPALAHDSLSQLEFGDGNEKSFLFAVSPAEPAAEALIAVVSLRNDDTVEVRLIRPGAAPSDGSDPPAGREPLFGLFTLERQEGDCGF